MNSDKNTAVITVLGNDRVGIIAAISNLLAEYNININDISDKLRELGNKLGVQITIQHTGLFNAMHRI